jgi:hypothetical protein
MSAIAELETANQRLYKKMLEERGDSTLPDDRQQFYLKQSRFNLLILAGMNPATVDPSAEVEAYRRIRDEVAIDAAMRKITAEIDESLRAMDEDRRTSDYW